MFYAESEQSFKDTSSVNWESIHNDVNRHGLFYKRSRDPIYSSRNIINFKDNDLIDVGYTGTSDEFIKELECGIYNYWSTNPEDITSLGDRAPFIQDFVDAYEEYESDSYTTDE